MYRSPGRRGRASDAVISVGPGFLLLAAFLYYQGGGAAVTAFFTAALAHELGHLAAIVLTGARVRTLRLTAAGWILEYGGALTQRQEMGIAAAGPIAGAAFAVSCLLYGSAYFRYAGLIALFSAFFNMLPVLPLDGGRLAEAALLAVMPERDASAVMRVAGTLCGAAVVFTGAALRSWAAAAVGIWMTALANIPELR